MNLPAAPAPPASGWWWALRYAAGWVGAVGGVLLALICAELIATRGRGGWSFPVALAVAWCLPLVAGQWHRSWKVAWLALALEVVFGAAAFPVLAFVSFVSAPQPK
jgi:hypothetical protein